MANKDELVRRVGGYSGDENGNYVVYDSRNPSSPRTKQDLGTSANAEKAAGVLNQLRADSEVIKKDMGIWRSVTPGYGSNTYGQMALEGLMDLKSMKNGSDLIVYDTETLGTAPFQRKNSSNLNFYTPTEIGFQHVKLVNGQLQTHDVNGKPYSSLSMLLRPNKEVFRGLKNLISDVSNGNWTGMTDDVRRTLSDLVLYAGDPSQLFTTVNKDGRRITMVNKQARDLHPLKGSVLTSSENISLMRQGLANLARWGTKPENAVLEMNSFMRNMQDVRFAGYNVYNFDQPMMMDFLNEQIGRHKEGSEVYKSLHTLKNSMALNQIDGLHAVRTLYRDTYSRYGENVTLETMKDVFGMQGTGQSHHALSDVNVTVEQLNRLMRDGGISQTLLNGGKKGTPYGTFNNKPIAVGDRLFGVAGMSSRNAGEYDGIYRRREGKLVSAYDMTPNPIYRNATYQVQNFFDGIQIEGKKMYGVELYNETDDLVHTIFRNSMGDLQNAIHGHLEHIDKKLDIHTTASRIQNEDRGLRRWRKMFSTESGGGIRLANRMYDALDKTREIDKRTAAFLDEETYIKQGMTPAEAKEKVASNKKRIQGMQKRAILKQNQWNTDEFVRDFSTIKGRLEGEEKWVRGFMNKLQESPIKGNEGAQSLALSEFGKLMDNKFGTNMVNRLIPNNGEALALNIDGRESYLNLTNADGIRGSLYGHLYQGGGRPSMGTLKKRYRDLLMQLKSYNAMDAKKFEQLYKAMDGVRHDSSFDNLLGELANTVARARETNSLNGALRRIDVEDPTTVRGGKDGRAGKLKKDVAFDRLFNDMATQAINGVSPYTTINGGKRLQLTGNAMSVIQEHDEAVRNMLSRNNLNPNNIKSAAESLNDLVNTYQKQGLNVQLRMEEKTKRFQMVLANKSVSESILNGSIKDIMASNGTAVIDLPRINKNGTLTRGSQNRVSRLVANRVNGGYEFTTGFDEVIGSLKNSANTVQKMLGYATDDGRNDGMNNVHSYLNSRARKAMENLSMNNRYANPGDKENMFEIKSRAANWVRGGAIDISNVAEDWYTGWYNTIDDDRKKLWRLQTPEKIAQRARENGEKFVQHMGMQAERIFQREADDFMNQKGLGLNLGMHSVKDTHVANYLRSNLDARELLAFGAYNPMARENIMKTVNYMSLDEDKVRQNLRAQGFSKEEIDRMTRRGVVSSRALEVMEEFQEGEGKVSYLNMRSAYMNNEQLKDKASELATEYERRAGLTTGAEKEKWLSYAEKVKNAEAISTFDGMMLMSQEAAQGFETTRQKSIKLSPGAELTKEMKMVLNGGDWEKFDPTKDVTLEKGVALNRANFYQDAENWKSKKKVTVSEMVKEELSHMDEDGNPVFNRKTKADKVYDKWYLNDAKVVGWDAENQSVILEEKVRTMNTSKFITEAGGRLTGTLLPGEIISDLAGAPEGQKVHAILPSFEVGKGMYGTELSRLVGLAVDEAKAQVDGTHNGKLTAGNIGKTTALETINEMFRNSFGIKDESLSKVQDGSIVVDRLIGTDGKHMEYNFANVNKFLNNVDEYLGTNFANGERIYGNVGIGKQDVYDWENGIGLTDGSREGLVKYGRKEVDMVTSRANQVLGKGNAVVGWLQDHLTKAAEAQNPDIRRIASGLIRTTVEGTHITPDSGDVVIRTTGPAFDVDDPMGRERGRITSNGVREISMHAFNEIPTATVKETKFIADDYAKTIVDFGRVEGTFGDSMTFSHAISRNGGTALLEMPDETFAKKYIRLVDFGDVTKGGTADTPILRELQNIQKRIWSGIKEYQSVTGTNESDAGRIAEIRGRVDDLVTQYDDKVARMTMNARDDGIMKTFASAEMDMSGRFRIQGTNPLASYEKGEDGSWRERANARYKEGTVNVSKGRFLEMIEGAETNIADTLGIKKVNGVTVSDLAKKDISTLRSEIVKQMLDPDNGKGLYGFVNRYPTIKKSTIQALEVKIDDTLADDDRGARIAAGTAKNLKADYDGDFLSTVLAHYKTENAQAIHNELKVLQGHEAEAGRIAGAGVLKDLESDMSSIAKEMNLTVGELTKQANLARQIQEENRTGHQKKLVDLFDGAIQHRMNAKDALETREARLGKAFVGIIDNTRDKVLGLATAVVDTLEETKGRDGQGLISQIRANTYRNVIEETTAAFSQDLISSKKFNVDSEIERQKMLTENQSLSTEEIERRASAAVNERHFKVQDMNEYLLNLTDENRQKFVEHNREIGLFDPSDKKAMVQMESALDMIQDVQRWTAKSGGALNKSLLIGVSEGQSKDIAQRLFSGSGDMIVPTQAAKTMAELAPEELGRTVKGSMDKWVNNLVQSFSDSTGESQSLLDSMGTRAIDASDHTLSGATVAENSAVRMKEVVGKFVPKSFSGGGLAGGAVAFGAMWAASALVRSGPTPEGLEEQVQTPAPVPKQVMQTPTARITENNGEYINLRISAKNAQNMSEQDVAALVHQEIGSMTSVSMNTTLNVNDNTQNIDQEWLQGVVANAIDKGYGF